MYNTIYEKIPSVFLAQTTLEGPDSPKPVWQVRHDLAYWNGRIFA